MSLGGRPCAQGKRREIVPAVPMGWGKRLDGYARQNDGGALKPGQRRRYWQKRRAQDSRRAAAEQAEAS